MVITTTPTIQGYEITEYYGIVTGEAILGANVFKDLFAGIRDIVGGRSAAYEEELRRARRIALDEMEAEAEDLGATAIVGVDLDYETIGISRGGTCSWSRRRVLRSGWRGRNGEASGELRVVSRGSGLGSLAGSWCALYTDCKEGGWRGFRCC